MLEAQKQEAAVILEPIEDEDDSKFDDELQDLQEIDQTLAGIDTDGDDDQDDLNDYQKLKAKTQSKVLAKQGFPASQQAPRAKQIQRTQVIDDWIRNLLSQFKLNKTLQSFQNEWNELQKKGTFQDNQIGLSTDIATKNLRLEKKVKELSEELAEQQVVSNKAKSTWEQLRKERDFHRTNQQRVEKEKKQLHQKIKKFEEILQDYQQRGEQIKKKYESTMKEKTLMKLQRDKLTKKANHTQTEIKKFQEKATRQIQMLNAAHTKKIKRQQLKATVGFPDDARPNPLLSRQFEEFQTNLQQAMPIDAHSASVSNIAIHSRKQFLATVSDDCTWKIWNMQSEGSLMMSGQGHKDWICGVDFHPSGSHLATSSGDKSVKIWDFANSCCTATFLEHKQPVWAVKFHDTGDFLLSASMDSQIKLYDLRSGKVRQAYRGHQDSVNNVNFQPYTNFFTSASGDKTVSIWDMRTTLTVQTFYGHLSSVNDSNFSIGGQLLASCDSDGIVKVWDIRTVQELFQIDLGNIRAQKLCFDKTGKVVCIGCSDGTIHLVDVNDQKQANVLKGHEDAINGLVVSHDNYKIYSVSSDKTIRQWR